MPLKLSMGILRDVFAILLLISMSVLLLGWWLYQYKIPKIQDRIRDEVRSQLTPLEYKSLQWESNPDWMKLKKLEDRIIEGMLIAIVFLVIVGFIWSVSDSDGACSNRFEDYC